MNKLGISERGAVWGNQIVQISLGYSPACTVHVPVCVPTPARELGNGVVSPGPWGPKVVSPGLGGGGGGAGTVSPGPWGPKVVSSGPLGGGAGRFHLGRGGLEWRNVKVYNSI